MADLQAQSCKLGFAHWDVEANRVQRSRNGKPTPCQITRDDVGLPFRAHMLADCKLCRAPLSMN